MRALYLVLIAALAAFAASAQSPPDPPPLIELIRVPSGAKISRPYAGAKAAIDVIGLTSMTGLPETWLVEMHPTFASIEELDRALGSAMPTGPANEFGEAQDELLGSPRTLIAAYQHGLGYRANEVVRMLAKTRYFRISIYRMRPGNEDSIKNFTDVRKQRYDSAGLDRPELVYRVVSGAPAGTYLVMAPLTSLRQIDDGIVQLPAYLEPLAGEAGWANASQLLTGREHLLFRVDPRSSYVSAAFAGDDAEFWKPQR